MDVATTARAMPRKMALLAAVTGTSSSQDDACGKNRKSFEKRAENDSPNGILPIIITIAAINMIVASMLLARNALNAADEMKNARRENIVDSILTLMNWKNQLPD